MRTSNLAIVFTDIKGFTERTGRQSHEENQRMLRLHAALLMPVFRAFEGRLVKTIGDAFMVVFGSPTKAVLSGAAIQDRLWDYNRRVPKDQQIHVRVAVNLGEVREDRGDVFGEPVNIAARVEGIADAGEVVFTEAVYLAMNRAEVPAEDRGTHALKGIAHPIRLYRVPRGAYKLEPAQGEPAPAEAPPYGGFGLARAGKLPPVDARSLAEASEIVPQLIVAMAATMARSRELGQALLPAMRAAGPLLPRARAVLLPLAGRARALVERLPRRGRLPALVAALAALALLGFLLARGDAVERALDRGDVHEARRLVEAMPRGAARVYDEGRVEEARGSFGPAADSYARAAANGDRRGFRRLVKLTASEKCRVRESAARGLAALGDRAAASTLEKLAKGSFADEGDDSALGSLFGCSSHRAARDALERLHGE